MELPKTPDDLVTPLAVAIAARAMPIKTLATMVQCHWQDVRDWECGRAPVPSGAMARRLGMALRWKWTDLTSPSLAPDEAWEALLKVRQRIAAAQ